MIGWLSTGGRSVRVAALSSVAIFLATFGCGALAGCGGSGDDDSIVDSGPTESEGSTADHAAPDGAREGGGPDASPDAPRDAKPGDVAVEDAKDVSIPDVGAADVAHDVANDVAVMQEAGSDAGEAGKDAAADAAREAGADATVEAGVDATMDAPAQGTTDAPPDVATEEVDAVADAPSDVSTVLEPTDAAEAGGGCQTAADCPAPANDCQSATCTLGVCGVADRPAATACTSNGGSRCNGVGACVACLTADDCPAQGTSCRANTCIGNVCGTTNAAAASACGDHGGVVCDGAGSCVQCLQPTDCPAQSTVCRTNTCVGNVCGTANTMISTRCNEHGGQLCDGAGSCVACISPGDCPAQATSCKMNTCVGNVCGATNALLGTACTDNGGVTCDGNGSCAVMHCMDGVKDADETDVDCGGSCGATCADGATPQACLAGGDCASGVCGGAAPKVCQRPSCTDGVKNGAETDVDCGGSCGACADQKHCAVDADCHSGSCSGSGPGTCVSCTDGVKDGTETDTDCGGAFCDGQGKTCAAGAACGSAADCTGSAGGACNVKTYTAGAACTSGVCVAGTTLDCGAGGMVCSPTLGCVGCNVPADCPATGNECVLNTCNANVCGTTFAGMDVIVTTGQTAFDCQKVVCNGMGGTTSADNFSDPPIPSTKCLIGSCVAGADGGPLGPVTTPAAAGTDCTADGQLPKHVCGDPTNPAIAGTCVECNTDADCTAPATCVANACH